MTAHHKTIKLIVNKMPEGCWECPFSVPLVVAGGVFKQDKAMLYRCSLKRKHPECCKKIFQVRGGSTDEDARND
jgi:hypothetical protein